MYMHYYNSLILYKLFKRPIQPIPILIPISSKKRVLCTQFLETLHFFNDFDFGVSWFGFLYVHVSVYQYVCVRVFVSVYECICVCVCFKDCSSS